MSDSEEAFLEISEILPLESVIKVETPEFQCSISENVENIIESDQCSNEFPKVQLEW